MPSVNDIVGIAESLQKCPLSVDRDRCVAVRNRRASCRACIQACPTDAITIEENDISVNPSTCTGCGACAPACPTEALIPLDPTPPEVARAAIELTEADGTCTFACARIASKKLADPAGFVEVPCLTRFDERHALVAAAHGAREVRLVDGGCRTCRFRHSAPAIDAAAETANALLEAQGSPVRVTRMSQFPEDMPAYGTSEDFRNARRTFFSDTVAAAREMTVTAANSAIAQELGVKEAEEPLGKRLRVDSKGNLPRFEMKRHNALLNAMFEVGQPAAQAVSTRVFGSVEVDTEKCSGCGMCAVFCPTGAMTRDERKKPYNNPAFLEFSASACVGCRLCEDVCWKNALAFSPEVDLDQLFDFEPLTFWLREK